MVLVVKCNQYVDIGDTSDSSLKHCLVLVEFRIHPLFVSPTHLNNRSLILLNCAVLSLICVDVFGRD